MEFFRSEIRAIAGPAAAIGASALRRDGLVYVIEAGTVITVIPDDR